MDADARAEAAAVRRGPGGSVRRGAGGPMDRRRKEFFDRSTTLGRAEMRSRFRCDAARSGAYYTAVPLFTPGKKNPGKFFNNKNENMKMPLEDRTALLCDQCGIEIFVDENGVMLNDDLWKKINGDSPDFKSKDLCDTCIEQRLGRPIAICDMMPGEHATWQHTAGMNYLWIENQLRKLTKK